MQIVFNAALIEAIAVMSTGLGFAAGFAVAYYLHRLERRRYRRSTKHLCYLERLVSELQTQLRAQRVRVPITQASDPKRPFVVVKP